eukprot:scaffold87652_cov55-Phaeocystis_antarctica.AAC.3
MAPEEPCGMPPTLSGAGNLTSGFATRRVSPVRRRGDRRAVDERRRACGVSARDGRLSSARVAALEAARRRRAWWRSGAFGGALGLAPRCLGLAGQSTGAPTC